MGYEALLDDEVIEKTLWEMLLRMQDQAAFLCEVDSGILRDSITVSTKSNIKSVAGIDSQFPSPSSALEGYIGSMLEYAAAKEFGRPDVPNYPADPYLRPAVDIIGRQTGRIGQEAFSKAMAEYANRFPQRLQEGAR
jgi:hypothetical protein